MRSLFATVVCLCLLSLQSCAPVYVPTARNVPMFSKKGEALASASSGNAGFNVQGAAALTNHLFVAGTLQAANNNLYRDRNDDGENRYRKHRAADFAVGYYLRSTVFFEASGGIGVGKGYAQGTYDFLFFPGAHKTLSVDYTRYFIQAAIGSGGDYFEGAISFRFSHLEFSSLDLTLDGQPEFISDRPRLFFEPALTGRVYPAANGFFINAQVGMCTGSQQNENEVDEFEHSVIQVSFGAGYRFNRTTKRNSEKK